MIRNLEERDIVPCLNIYNYYILHTTATFETDALTEKEFAERVHSVTEKYPWIVFEEDGKVKGYAYLSAFNVRAAYDWTCDLAIYVSHEHTGEQIGSRLMQEIIQKAKDSGFVTMVSLITYGNAGSEKLHEKFGFERKAVFENVGYKSGRWLNVSYYLKELNKPDDHPQKPTCL